METSRPNLAEIDMFKVAVVIPAIVNPLSPLVGSVVRIPDG